MLHLLVRRAGQRAGEYDFGRAAPGSPLVKPVPPRLVLAPVLVYVTAQVEALTFGWAFGPIE